MEFKMSKDKWLLELKKMKKKYGCKRGKLIFLPIIKNPYTFMDLILIPKKDINIPEYARKYVLAHEFGHVYKKHNLLSYFLVFAICLIFINKLEIVYMLLGGIIITQGIFAEYFEYQADKMAVLIVGKQTVIDGFMWFAKRTKSENTIGRKIRLERILNVF